MKKLAGRVAVITGAGSGIGRALAENLGAQNCRLALADINEKGLKETADSLKAKGVEVFIKKLDVANREAVYAFADEVMKQFGEVHMRSEEHTSELQSLMRISYAVFCL